MVVERTECRAAGQERAFLALIKWTEDELRAFVGRRVGSGHVTRDIVQNTFLSAWRDAHFDPEHARARAWLFKTARRLTIDWLRSEASKSISLDDLGEWSRGDGSRGSRSALPVDRKSRDPLILLIEEEMGQNLETALAGLPAEQREVLERYYLRQDGTQHEIAEAMHLSLAAFNSRLNRARQQLKRSILNIRGRDDRDEIDHDS